MLRITHIHLNDIRNCCQADVAITGRLTIFVGPNAAGKTNVVEAVQLLTAGQSFRHARSADLIRHGATTARAVLTVADEVRHLEMSLAINETTRTYALNGKAKRVADMRGIMPSVAFTPDDLDLVKGSPAHRRDALDALGVQLNKNYQVILRDFEKILRHKNRLLKEGEVSMLDAVNELYVKVAAQLQNYRRALFARLEPQISAHYAHIADGETLHGYYEASGQTTTPASTDQAPPRKRSEAAMVDSQALAAAVEAHRVDELAAHRTLVGPSHDRIMFQIEGMDATRFASQGQQRSAVLAWKLAEADTINDVLGTFPVLLLDDVMSELDAHRRAAFVRYLQHDIQAFITTANLDYFDREMIQEAQIVQLPFESA